MYQNPRYNVSPPRETVHFPFRRCVEDLYKVGAAIFVLILVALMTVYGDHNKHQYIYPCRYSKITYGKLNELRAEINATAKEMESISFAAATVTNYNFTLNQQIMKKYENLTAHKNMLEEKWISHKFQYYECYKNNILEAFYRTPGNYIIIYYIFITIIFLAIFTVLHKSESRDLTPEQIKAVKEYYLPAKMLWILHLFACPIIVYILFYSDDIFDNYKKQFPIHPHFEQMVDVN